MLAKCDDPAEVSRIALAEYQQRKKLWNQHNPRKRLGDIQRLRKKGAKNTPAVCLTCGHISEIGAM